MSDFYENYLKVCQSAVDDDEVFKNFKSHCDYTLVLEHVKSYEGLDYYLTIKKEFPYLLQFMEKFATNDNIGNPKRFFYEEIGIEISPTTLRYIKVLADLLNLFGRLDNMDIVEIGGGYGGQCKIICDFSEPKSYTLVDRHEVLLLNEKYLKCYDVKNVIFREVDDESENHYDLCISNYAFSEVPRPYQNRYAEKIIKNSDRGYMTCNIFGNGSPDELMAREDIFALKSGYRVIPEVPITAVNNFIYMWDDTFGE